MSKFEGLLKVMKLKSDESGRGEKNDVFSPFV